MSGGKICRVCDNPVSAGRGKSKEHVIPNWMQKHFQLDRETIAYTPLESLDLGVSMQLTPPASHHPQRKHNFGSFLVGSVCKNCNDGWMSYIEVAAKQELIELIEGRKAVSQSLAVARWAAKTAFTFTISTDPPIGRVPQRHMLHLKRDPGLPIGVRVFGRVDDNLEWWFSSAATYQTLSDLSKGEIPASVHQRHIRNSYRYFFRLGKLTLLVQYWPSHNDAVDYDPTLLQLIGANGKVGQFHDDFEFPVPGLNYDLAIRSTRSWLNYERRPLGDLCACGSGLLATICTMQGHPDNPAGNWGWI